MGSEQDMVMTCDDGGQADPEPPEIEEEAVFTSLD